MNRAIRLYYERVVGTAALLAVLVPLYFLVTGYEVAGPKAVPLACGTTIGELGHDRGTTTDPAGACHAGAVTRLHVAGGYLVAFLAVGIVVWLVAGARERALNRAWEAGRAGRRRVTTPGEVWLLAGVLFVVFVGFTQAAV